MDFLEDLEIRDNCQNKRQSEQTVDDAGKIQHATQKILQLRRHRDALKSQLKMLDTMIAENNVSIEDDSTPDMDSDELKEIKEHHSNLSLLLDCFRLTGFSVFSVDNTHAIFSYDTSYKGVSHETFYLEIQDMQNKNFQLTRHSFPCFIPVLELEQKLLKVDPKQFLNKLGDYLFAYVTRREEVNIVKKTFDRRLKVTCSEPVDFIEITMGHAADILQLEFQLTYTELLHTKTCKSRLTVIVNDDSEGHSVKPKEKLVNKWKTSLQTQLLSEAITDIMNDYSKLVAYTFND